MALCSHFVFVGLMDLKMMSLIGEEFFELEKIMGLVGIGSIMNPFFWKWKILASFFSLSFHEFSS